MAERCAATYHDGKGGWIQCALPKGHPHRIHEALSGNVQWSINLKAKVDELTATLAQTEQAQRAQRRADFEAGWQDGVNSIDRDGMCHSSAEEDFTAYLASQARQEPT